MKILDFHFHVGTKEHWNPWVIEFFSKVNPFYIKNFSEEITPEDILKYLDSQGVRKAVILSEYAPRTTGVVTNESVSNFCSKSERLIPFGSIDFSSRYTPSQQLEYVILELGMKGLKLLPSYSYFYPNDPALFTMYEKAQELKIPILFHTGTSIFKGSRIKYSNPLFLDDVADTFPELNIILAHGGRSFWYKEANWMLLRHKNVYIDISGIPQRQLLTHFPKIETFSDRFIFGSDWPGISDIKPMIEKLMDTGISEDTLKKILWENGNRLLSLS